MSPVIFTMCPQPNRPLSIYPKARALPFHPLFLPLFKNELKLLFEFELLSQKGCCEKGQVICIYYRGKGNRYKSLRSHRGGVEQKFNIRNLYENFLLYLKLSFCHRILFRIDLNLKENFKKYSFLLLLFEIYNYI